MVEFIKKYVMIEYIESFAYIQKNRANLFSLSSLAILLTKHVQALEVVLVENQIESLNVR